MKKNLPEILKQTTELAQQPLPPELQQQVKENLQKHSKSFGDIVGNTINQFLSGEIGIGGIFNSVKGQVDELEKKIELEAQEEQKKLGNGDNS